MASKAQEEAGLDIVTDGEIRRESYSDGSPPRSMGWTSTIPVARATGRDIQMPCPELSGEFAAGAQVEVEDLQFLKRHTTHMVKMTVPGPFTMCHQAQNDFYPNPEAAAMDYAIAVNAEIKDLFAAGPTSSKSTNRTCRHGRQRRRNMGSERSMRRWTASSERRRFTFVLAMPRSFTNDQAAIRF